MKFVFMLHITFSAMIQNFFRIAIRNISRHKGFTFINVTGLAVGLAASLLILLWVQDELSFEKFNRMRKIFTGLRRISFIPGTRYHVTVTPYPSGPVWKEKIPEIKEQTRINQDVPGFFSGRMIKYFLNHLLLLPIQVFFKIFTFPLVVG